MDVTFENVKKKMGTFMTHIVNYPSCGIIQDICCIGINPLRCIICQENRKLDGKTICNNISCISTKKRFQKQKMFSNDRLFQTHKKKKVYSK
jgi:hypothetical protein